jgi:hypothetical protein
MTKLTDAFLAIVLRELLSLCKSDEWCLIFTHGEQKMTERDVVVPCYPGMCLEGMRRTVHATGGAAS